MTQNDLRPDKFDDILGQKNVVEQLKITVESAKKRNAAMPHLLFNGPAGLGKTTLSCAVANERGVSIQIANGGNIRSVKHILPYLASIEENSILFVDEIHRLRPDVEEFLYPVMEDFRADIGKDTNFKLDIPKFTMIGATTEAGSLAKPLYDRFTMKYELELYKSDALAEIVQKNADKLDLSINLTAAKNLAIRSRGTPRIANNLLKWVRDVAVSKGHRTVSETLVDEAMGMVGVDRNGVTRRDRKYLAALKRASVPLGLKTLVDATNIDRQTIEYVIEPFLIRNNLIRKTSKGRVLV